MRALRDATSDAQSLGLAAPQQEEEGWADCKTGRVTSVHTAEEPEEEGAGWLAAGARPRAAVGSPDSGKAGNGFSTRDSRRNHACHLDFCPVRLGSDS